MGPLIMRKFLFAAAAALTLAAPANAQQVGDLSGTWAFQTAPYGNEQFGIVMSGAAIIAGQDVRLITNELIIERATGRSQVLTARQTCRAENADGQVSITCQMAEPLQGYEPDNFILQAGEGNDQLVGALSSATSATVTFNRMR
jgi:hypothetical protein